MTILSPFSFVDEISEVKKNESLTAYFTLKGSEEFLQDHFDGFPVMPGVLLLESLKQAGVRLLQQSQGAEKPPLYRLSSAEQVKFGQFVRPGSLLKIFVRRLRNEGTKVFLEGRIDLVKSPEAAAGKKALTAGLILAPLEA